MWRVGSAERYPHHGPPSNAVVVNGASGELVSWDRAEETLRSLRCSKPGAERSSRYLPPGGPKSALSARKLYASSGKMIRAWEWSAEQGALNSIFLMFFAMT